MTPARAITIGAAGMLAAITVAAVVVIAVHMPGPPAHRPYTSPPGPVPSAPAEPRP